jgi:hypothetical protein
MGESQCLAFCGDRWKRRKGLLGEGLFLRKFENDVGVNESSPFFVGGKEKLESFCYIQVLNGVNLCFEKNFQRK